jgi:hypothetical protein
MFVFLQDLYTIDFTFNQWYVPKEVLNVLDTLPHFYDFYKTNGISGVMDFFLKS